MERIAGWLGWQRRWEVVAFVGFAMATYYGDTKDAAMRSARRAILNLVFSGITPTPEQVNRNIVRVRSRWVRP